MNGVDYVYTTGMTDTQARARLASNETGVLSFARDDQSYAVPMAYAYRGDHLLFRFGDVLDAEKVEFADATTVATFTIYDYVDPDHSWSVVVRGPIRRLEGTPDASTLNDLFVPFRVFDESVSDVGYDMYELRIEDVTGRTTLGSADDV